MEANGTSHGNFHGNFLGKVRGNLQGNLQGNLHGNLHGNPRQAPTAYDGRPRYNGKTHGMRVDMEYAVAVAVVPPWVAMVGITEVATDGTAERAMA